MATNDFFCNLTTLSLAASARSLAAYIGQSPTGNRRKFGPFCHSEFSSHSQVHRTTCPGNDVSYVLWTRDPPPVLDVWGILYFPNSVCEKCLVTITLPLYCTKDCWAIQEMYQLSTWILLCCSKYFLNREANTATHLRFNGVTLLVQTGEFGLCFHQSNVWP